MGARPRRGSFGSRIASLQKGETRVCAIVRAPTAEDEDTRQLFRERKTLTVERPQHVNRIRGLLLSQGQSRHRHMAKVSEQKLLEPVSFGFDDTHS
jgi:transposase